MGIQFVKEKGLDPQEIYCMEATGEEYSGAALMYGGLPIPRMDNEYQSWQVDFVKKSC